MKKICSIISGIPKFEKPKTYLFVLFIICGRFKNENEKLFKAEKSTEILIILGLIENM